MIYKNVDMYTLLDRVKEKSLICFGAGRQLKNACELYSDASLFEKIDYIADNDKKKNSFEFAGAEKPVYPIEYCIKHSIKEPVLLISMKDCIEVLDQLESMPELSNCECYICIYTRNSVKPYSLPKGRALKEPVKIPKIIHYSWFSGERIPNEFKSYIDTWRRYCPDYDIVCWDSSNYDYKKCEYAYEAYKQKKWGVVADYARVDIIYNHGGVYLDVDVELVRNIDDLLCDDAFCGFATNEYVNNGSGFGAVTGFPLILEQVEVYEGLSFVDKDGLTDMKTGPQYQTELFQSKGLELNNTLQKIQGMIVYPSDVLSPLCFTYGTLNYTENTYAIHHYAATWFDEETREKAWRQKARYSKLNELFITTDAD